MNTVGQLCRINTARPWKRKRKNKKKRPSSPKFNPRPFFFVFYFITSAQHHRSLDTWIGAIVKHTNQHGGKQIRSTTTKLLKQTKRVCRDCFQPSTEENSHKNGGKNKTNNKKKHSCWMWVLSAFSKSGNCNFVCVCVCVRACVCFVLVSFPSTSSYYKLSCTCLL